MFPVTTNGQGQIMTTGPTDVCKTPTPGGPVPMPYPNIAMLSDGSGSKKVKIQNKETLRVGDKIRMSTGDEPGSAGGGVVSNKIKGQAELKKGWSKVKAEGKEVGHQMVPASMNGGAAYNVPAGVTTTVMQ